MRERDPIHLGPIRKRFVLVRGSASVAYDAHSLLAYVCASGDACDPVTRQPLTATERRRLSRACGVAVPTADHLAIRRREEVARRELLFYLQDEFLAVSRHADDAGVHVLQNIHLVALDGELPGIYAHLVRNGADVAREQRLRSEVLLEASGPEERWEEGVPGW